MAASYDEIVLLSQSQMRIHHRPYRRYLFRENPFSSRFTMLLGPRGVGKTTAIIQHLLDQTEGDRLSPAILYVPSDHIVLKEWSLYGIAETFAFREGKVVCFDEIHKVEAWAQELKSVYDSFPELKVLASGSSALEIAHGSHDLSRRALVRHMRGLSLREYVEMGHDLKFKALSLEDLIENHSRHADEILKKLEGAGRRVLPIFHEYLRAGYYPFIQEVRDENLYLDILEQNVHAVLESDILAVNPSFTGATVRKMERLLSLVAESVPFKPDFHALKRLMEIGDERTLKNYLRLMEQAGLIRSLPSSGKGLRAMEKPEKVYLGNTNLQHALARARANEGTIRETFFLTILDDQYKVTAPDRGDFLVEGKWVFEVGGKSKGFSQIKEMKNSFLAVDDLERGTGRRIPLWLFGFLY